MNNTPIGWPEWWINRGWNIKFLVGMPFFGPHVRIRKMIEQQLLARDQGVLDQWGHDEVVVEIMVKASQVIQEEACWPNSFYIPEDNLLLLLGGIPGDEMDVDEIIARIFKACELSWHAEFSDEILWDDGSRFEDLVLAIATSKNRKTRK